jgi:AraC-like DNA-binding protein
MANLAKEDYTIALLLRGTGRVRFDGKWISIGEGDLIQRLPGVRHSLNRYDLWEWEELFITLPETVWKAHRKLGFFPKNWVLRKVFKSPEIPRKWLLNILESRHSDPFKRQLRFLELLRRLFHPQNREEEPKMNIRIKKALEIYRNEERKLVSLSRLASWAGMGTESFRKKFKLETGLSPHQFLMRETIEASKALLLETSWDLKTISAKLGYDNVSSYHIQFKKLVGITPNRYRQSFE